MKSINIGSKVKFKYIILFIILLSIILLYPDSLQGFLIYIQQLIVGFYALYAITQIKIIKPIKTFIIFALYMTIMNFILSIMNGERNIFNIFISSLRLYYPFLGLIIGGWCRKHINPKIFYKIIVCFIGIQFIISFLQINNESFRVWSYNLYTSSMSEYYLKAFSWETGRRAIGTLANPNLLGMLIVILNCTVQILPDLYEKKRFSKIVNTLCAIASLYVCIYTQSRTSLILWVVTTGIIIFWKISGKGIVNVLYLFVSMIFGSIIFFNLKGVISRDISFVALSPRFNLWLLRIPQIFEAAKYEDFFTIILGIGFTQARKLSTFDNSFIKYFASGGVIGLLIFIKTILDSTKYFLKRTTTDVWNRLGLIIILVWILGSFVAEYQEALKLSLTTFILLGYAMYQNILIKSN